MLKIAIDNIIESRTLFELADNLHDFLSNIGDNTIARHQIINLKKAVYEIANQFALGQYFSYIRDLFVIFDGRLAVIEYLVRQWSNKQSLRIDFNKLKSITTIIKNYIGEPMGKMISEEAVSRLIMHINEQIGFSHLVLNEQKLFILMLPYTHQKWDSDVSHITLIQIRHFVICFCII